MANKSPVEMLGFATQLISIKLPSFLINLFSKLIVVCPVASFSISLIVELT